MDELARMIQVGFVDQEKRLKELFRSELQSELGPFKIEMYEFKTEMYSFKDEMYRFKLQTMGDMREVKQRLGNLEVAVNEKIVPSLEMLTMTLRGHHQRLNRLERKTGLVPAHA